MTAKCPHINVCICTYKRPHLLANLLKGLEDQITEDLFSYSAVVVDNDPNQSAKDAVRSFRDESSMRIDYHHESIQNIALARNRAVEGSTGDYVAFIDDDEFPEAQWLLSLFGLLQTSNCSGALGPVNPHYPEGTPDWLKKSKLCERPRHKTGTILHWGDTRTGNVLLRAEIFADSTHRFGPQYGRTGGEDIEFFKMMIEKGKRFVWCDAAVVYETVTPDRWGKKFYIQRYLRIGSLVGEKIRRREGFLNSLYALAKSVAWIALLTMASPFLLIAGEHIAMRGCVKVMYNFGLITSYFGYVMLRERDE